MRRTLARTFMMELGCGRGTDQFGLPSTLLGGTAPWLTPRSGTPRSCWAWPTLASEDDAATIQVVRRHFDGDGVARCDADVVFPHPPGHVGVHLLTIFKLDHESRARKGFLDDGDQSDGLFFSHADVFGQF
jgi:hypothetical protein